MVAPDTETEAPEVIVEERTGRVECVGFTEDAGLQGAFPAQTPGFLGHNLPDGVRIGIESNPGTPADCVVNGNPIQLHPVRTDPIENAWEALPDGGDIRCRLRRRDVKVGDASPAPGVLPGDWIAIDVSDTEIGIPPKDLPRIFEPSFSGKQRKEDVGRGLPQPYGVLRQHRGFASVESKVGEGTAFTIFLPASSGNGTVEKTDETGAERRAGP